MKKWLNFESHRKETSHIMNADTIAALPVGQQPRAKMKSPEPNFLFRHNNRKQNFPP